ncbi:MAG: ABC transporter ATP-binding protein [Elusimicrobiaceae bacterium]|nr:ABC transporter ATP-binding protein [Elusimicrobiaceae bacterium]
MNAAIEIQHLYKTYSRGQWFGGGHETPVLKDVSLVLPANRVLGLVGESGCGKSTLCKVLLGIEKPTSGTVLVENQNVAKISKTQFKNLRRVMQVVYQDPYSSLDPRMTVRQLLSEPLDIHGLYPQKTARTKFLKELLSAVGLAPNYLERYPHEFSGGQRQRISIARALTLDPKILIADEPVSALDVSVQAQILNLLRDISRARKLAMLFVTHDFAVARFLCDDIAVMYQGRIVEKAPAQELFTHPLHPYTRMLLAAVPQVGKKMRGASTPAAACGPNTEGACSFASRCPQAGSACRQTQLQEITPQHWCACSHLPEGENK